MSVCENSHDNNFPTLLWRTHKSLEKCDEIQWSHCHILIQSTASHMLKQHYIDWLRSYKYQYRYSMQRPLVSVIFDGFLFSNVYHQNWFKATENTVFKAVVSVYTALLNPPPLPTPPPPPPPRVQCPCLNQHKHPCSYRNMTKETFSISNTVLW